MSAAILVEDLSKRYELGALQRETQLRDQLMHFLRTPFRRRTPKEIIFQPWNHIEEYCGCIGVREDPMRII